MPGCWTLWILRWNEKKKYEINAKLRQWKHKLHKSVFDLWRIFGMTNFIDDLNFQLIETKKMA